MRTFLDFEKPVADLEGQIQELKSLETSDAENVSVADEIAALERKAHETLANIYSKLTPWQKTQVARHPDRPHARHYISRLITDFEPLAGDRKFGEDKAVVAGLGRFRGDPVAILAQEKGEDIQSHLEHNWGMARPEGYRKAVRVMEIADRFGLPIVSLIDSAGAYPGVDAEARGQAEAIARSTEACLKLGVPNLAVIIGEGMSGGAIAIATANRVYMLEHAIYSVISPEGAASILWRDKSRAQDAATAMKITAADLLSLRIIDGIVEEPLGGAQRDPDKVIDGAGEVIAAALKDLAGLDRDAILRSRREKFLAIGRSIQ
jgi:acetyl-CoA carboxylase carboxyl transferase subunit alpha